MERKFNKRLMTACLIIFSILISGCVSGTGNFASLRPDAAVKDQFESFTADSDLNYYYYGPITFPRAFVGISKDITLTSEDWKPIDLTSKDLRRWIWAHGNRFPGNKDRFGKNIVGPDGNRLGVWYSLEDWQQWARIEIHDQSMLKIGMPIYHKQNRKKFSPGGNNRS